MIPQDISRTVLNLLETPRKDELGLMIAEVLVAEREACALAASQAMEGYRPVGIDPELWPDPASAIRNRSNT